MKSSRKMREYRIAVAGQEGSGKTSLLNKITHYGSVDQYDPTGESWRRSVLVDDQADIIDLIDCPSIPEYAAFRKIIFETYDAIVLLFNAESWESFKDVRALHAEVVRARKEEDKGRRMPPVFLVANKLETERMQPLFPVENELDMERHQVVSGDETARLATAQLAQELSIQYMEVSCKTGEGIEKLTENVVRGVRTWKEEGIEMLGKGASKEDGKTEKGGKWKRKSLVEGIKELLPKKKHVV